MEYRSDVRIRLIKEDYEKLKEQFEKEMIDVVGYNLLDGKELDVYKELRDVSCWKVTDDGEDIEEIHDCIFFGWNLIKWYDEYKDVNLIMEYLENCDYYAFCRIGESGEGDIDSREKNMGMIGYYYVFEEEK